MVRLSPRSLGAEPPSDRRAGTDADAVLLRNNAPLGRLRGQFGDWNGTAVMPTYHPAYLLRTPSAKAQVWEDLAGDHAPGRRIRTCADQRFAVAHRKESVMTRSLQRTFCCALVGLLLATGLSSALATPPAGSIVVTERKLNPYLAAFSRIKTEAKKVLTKQGERDNWKVYFVAYLKKRRATARSTWFLRRQRKGQTWARARSGALCGNRHRRTPKC